MTMQNGPKGGIMLQVKEDVKVDFAWSYENFAQSCKMLQKAVIATVELLISDNHAKFVELVRNGYFVVKL